LNVREREQCGADIRHFHVDSWSYLSGARSYPQISRSFGRGSSHNFARASLTRESRWQESRPLSITPLLFLSRAKNASSDSAAVHDRRSLTPSSLRSKLTPCLASVSLKPLPDTSTKTGLSQFPPTHLCSSQLQLQPGSHNSIVHSLHWPLIQ